MGGSAADLHIPVLADEVISYLQPVTGGLYMDGTLGLGGHAAGILKAAAPDGRVIGFEWDEQAAGLAAERLAAFGRRLTIIRTSYADLTAALQQAGIETVDGLLLDLGVSSLQLDRGERGFSFQADAPLDMRMDVRQSITAAQLIRRLSKEQLADIFYNYGEERQARRIAAHIVQAREERAVETTRQLAEIVAAAVPRKFHPRKRHMATRVFQALRIAVNRELDNLVRVLADAPSVLRPGARMCVITFHSLEDRIVKQAFAANPAYAVVTRHPVEPSPDEVKANPRSRSAKLRVAVRTERRGNEGLAPVGAG
ncbi:ribosomal RNA small subunit methyltransferase H [bacterium BMS3Abin13]|nr:ribosomal RNA small subunit methyltransferase H [bacterium BMS3Abin13]